MSDGQWKVKTLGSFKASDSVEWRAQRSKAPDGKTFIGIRKYVLKKDGTEIADRAGISVLETDAPKQLPQFRKLMDLLLTAGPVKDAVKPGIKIKPRPNAHYIIVNAEAQVYDGKAFVDDLENARRYDEDAATTALEALPRAVKKVATVHDLRDSFCIRNISGKLLSRVADGEGKTGKTPQVFPTRIHALQVWREISENNRWKIVTKEEE